MNKGEKNRSSNKLKTKDTSKHKFRTSQMFQLITKDCNLLLFHFKYNAIKILFMMVCYFGEYDTVYFKYK